MFTRLFLLILVCSLPVSSWEASGELLYWRASTGDQRFLTVETGNTFQAAIVEPGRGLGFSLALGHELSCWDLIARWTHFNSTDSLVVELEGRNATLPFMPITAEPDAAKGSVKSRYDAVDLEGRTLHCLYIGLRFVDLRFTQLGHYIYLQMGSGERVMRDFSQPSHFWGVGPRVGLWGELPLCWGISVMGQLGGGFLSGEYQSAVFDASNEEAMFTTCFFSPTRWAVIPELEMRAALQTEWRCLEIELGYRMESYFSVLPSNYGNLVSTARSFYNVGFSGLYGRLTARF